MLTAAPSAASRSSRAPTASSTSSDIEIHARETLALRAQLDANPTGQSAEQVNADSERDRYMTPEEAVAYGLVDRIVKPR